jgi:hypothetical protein
VLFHDTRLFQSQKAQRSEQPDDGPQVGTQCGARESESSVTLCVPEASGRVLIVCVGTACMMHGHMFEPAIL